MRLAINGMGRIGRLMFRRILSEPEMELVAVNDIMDIHNLLYLLKYDSVYGTFPGNLCIKNDHLMVNGHEVRVLQCDHPSRLPWKEMAADIVLECSGKFSTKSAAEEHLKAGAGKVLLSSTGSADIPLMIYGYNHHQLTADINIVSPGGCMTNCAAHVLYILNSIGIESAHIHILHSYTSRQSLVDTRHAQFRRGRAASESIIPVEIDLAQSLERLLLPLHNKIAAVSTRVPVANGALADFTIQLVEPVTREAINHLFDTAAAHEYKNIIQYTEDPIVSQDIKGNTHSCVIDGTLTSVIGRQLKLIAWFDNEHGYTSRMLDWIKLLH